MDDSFWCITLLINTHCAAYTHYSNNVPKRQLREPTSLIQMNMGCFRYLCKIVYLNYLDSLNKIINNAIKINLKWEKDEINISNKC